MPKEKQVGPGRVVAVIRGGGVENIRKAPPWLIRAAIQLSNGEGMTREIVDAYPPRARDRAVKGDEKKHKRRRRR